ncbi:MAG: riboflavin biosynthesis protein RibF [Gaiellaceae bacterium]
MTAETSGSGGGGLRPAGADAGRGAAVAIGTFDGVHLGHRRVIEAARSTGLPVRVLTFHPHPRVVLGNFVEAISTLERRLELLAEIGVAETTVVDFTLEVSQLEPAEFAATHLGDAGVIVAGADFRFGRKRSGDLTLLEGLGHDVLPVPLLEGVSSTEIRRHVHGGAVREAARLLGRPAELEGVVVSGDQRGGTLGYPTANLAVEPALLVPAYGIYAGYAENVDGGSYRAAISIGTNPHYGGEERRIEPHLLDFEGDLYGRRLVVELWERLRDEQVFGSERELIEQIARDVEATREAVRPG